MSDEWLSLSGLFLPAVELAPCPATSLSTLKLKIKNLPPNIPIIPQKANAVRICGKDPGATQSDRFYNSGQDRLVVGHNLAENESKSGAYYRLLYIIDWLTSCRCVVEGKKQEAVCDKGSVSLRISYRCANTSVGTVSQHCWRQHWG